WRRPPYRFGQHRTSMWTPAKLQGAARRNDAPSSKGDTIPQRDRHLAKTPTKGCTPMMDGIWRVRKTAVLAALALSAGVLASTANAQSVISSNSFDGGDFSVGNLNGPSGWVVDSGTASVVTGPLTAAEGDGYVQLDANTAASLAAAAPGGTNYVIVEGYYYGAGSETLTAPTGGNPIAVLLGFRTIDGSNIAVAAYDGV